jgi:hypothetical protein
MGATGSSLSDAVADAAADVEVSVTEAVEALRGYTRARRARPAAARALARPRANRLTLARSPLAFRSGARSTKAAREKGWKAIGIVSLRDAKLRARARRPHAARPCAAPVLPLSRLP